MNKKYSSLASLILLISILYCAVIMTMILFKNNPSDKFNDSGLLTISEAIDKNYKSVVSIIVELDVGLNSGGLLSSNQKIDKGSGIVLSKDGYIVTNYHVIKDAKKIFVKLYNGQSYKVKKTDIFKDRLTDIAVIKIDEDNLLLPTIGNSDNIKVGEEVIALGNPLGLFNISNQVTATKGIVSAKNIDFGFNDSYGSTYKGMIQTDASINPGNSGGPLLNRKGEIIGLNTFVITGSNNQRKSVGLNFAIPINQVIDIYSTLRADGEIDRGFNTGATVMGIDEILMDMHRIKTKDGVIVSDVEKKSLSEKTGIKIKDVILKINDKDIYPMQDTPYDFDLEIEKVVREELLRVGDEIKLIILRDNNQIELNLILDKGGF